MDQPQPDAPVRVEKDGDVAVIVIDNPPVNAGSTAVRRGLLDAIASVAADETVSAAVLIGAGNTFIAGSDIKEFDKPLLEPQLPAVIAVVESCPKPVVAAIHGAALGGGFELALGCDARVAVPGAVVGLPEVKLGMIPGAGGTQRMPRLTGVARAIEIITSGRRVPGNEAERLGLVDKVVTTDLREAAVAHARSLSRKRRLSEMTVPADAPGEIDAAAAKAVAAGRGMIAPGEAVAAVRMAESVPFAEAVRREREIFQGLRNGEESAALRHLFFAERKAMRGPAGAKARTVKRVGVVGLGLMGSGIAATFAVAGYDVLAAEQDASRLDQGIARAADAIRSMARRARLSDGDVEAAIARIARVGKLDELADADFVIEAIVEDMDAKEALLGDLGRILRSGAIIASNTSYLDIDRMAHAVPEPEDFAGFHFFSPAHVMRLIEVVRGARTAPDVIATLVAVARRLGKLPVTAGASEGFIGNRILAAYRQQCDFLLEEGAYPKDVDDALTGFGMAMGPYAVSDLAGLDISWQMRKRRAADRDPRARYFPAADRLCEQGRFGRKTGAGWYRYGEDGRTPVPDPDVHALIDRLSAESGTARRSIGADEIVSRVMTAIVNEACLILGEGVAERPSDIDLVMVNGYGFPAAKGGPLFWAARQPRAGFLESVDAMIAASGFGKTAAPGISACLDQATE